MSKYHLFVIFGVEVLLPLKSLCENVYGASAEKNDGCQKHQNVAEMLLLTTGVGQRCLDWGEPAQSTGTTSAQPVIPPCSYLAHSTSLYPPPLPPTPPLTCQTMLNNTNTAGIAQLQIITVFATSLNSRFLPLQPSTNRSFDVHQDCV